MARLNRVLLFSGGLDSFVAWRLLGEPPCLYVPLSHRYQAQELATIGILQCRFGMDVSFDSRLILGDYEAADAHIPMRNLFLAAVGALHANTVYLGALNGELSWDKSAPFFHQTSALLSRLNETPVRILAPFRRLTKTRLVAAYLRDHHWKDLLWTRSCYDANASTRQCGRCQACFRRWVALSLNGIDETYQHDPGLCMLQRLRHAESRASVLQSTRHVPLARWPEIVRNNLDALLALARWYRNR